MAPELQIQLAPRGSGSILGYLLVSDFWGDKVAKRKMDHQLGWDHPKQGVYKWFSQKGARKFSGNVGLWLLNTPSK